MLRAYIDESVEPNGNYILAGYISTEDRWTSFISEWEKMLRPFGILDSPSNNYYFKYSEMSRNPERQERIQYFEKVIKKHVILAISCRIHLGDLASAKQRIVVPGLEIDYGPYNDPYKLAFRCLMDKFHSHRNVSAFFIPETEPINFVFDEQLMSQKAILSGWNEYIAMRPENLKSVYGAPPVFKSDKECLPLQAADLWAGMVRAAYAAGDVSSVLTLHPKDNSSLPCLHIEWTEDDLVKDFVKLLRDHTDKIIYDIRYGSAWDVLQPRDKNA